MEGTRDLTSWFVVSQSCDFVESLGYPAIRARHFELSSFVREALSGLGGFQLCTPNHPQLRGGLTSFRLPANVDGQKLRNDLWQKDKIEINVIDLGGCQYFRVSTHVYNTMEEIVTLAKSLRSMLR